MTTEKRRELLTKNLASISFLCELINIYYINSIKDTKFRSPRTQSKAQKIQEFVKSIQSKELGQAIKLKADSKDKMENEHALQLFRVFDHFVFMPTDQLEEFADSLDKDYQL